MSEPLFPVVILAGGLATRLGPLTRTVPKCLIEVAGEPFVFHQLRRLREQGIHDVVLCLGHLGELVVDLLGDGSQFGLNVSYSFDGPRLLGTAGGIKCALPKLSETFFVLYGDSYLDCNYADVQETYRTSGKLGLMTVFANEARWDASNVEYANGQILSYDKVQRTGAMRYIDYGLGVLHRRAFDNVPDGAPYDLALVYQDLLRTGQLAAFEATNRFYEIGSHEGLEETRQHLARPSLVSCG